MIAFIIKALLTLIPCFMIGMIALAAMLAVSGFLSGLFTWRLQRS